MNTLTRATALTATTALVAGVGLAGVGLGAGSAAAQRPKAPRAAPVVEGHQATVTVRLRHPAHKNTTLTWRTVSGTAKAGSDFTALQKGRVLFHRGYRKATLQVPTLDDAATEGREHFFVQFNGRAHAARLVHARLKVVIKDNDSSSSGPTRSGSAAPSASVTPAPAATTTSSAPVSGPLPPSL